VRAALGETVEGGTRRRAGRVWFRSPRCSGA